MQKFIRYIKGRYWFSVSVAAILPSTATAIVEYLLTDDISGTRELIAALIGGSLAAFVLVFIKTPESPGVRQSHSELPVREILPPAPAEDESSPESPGVRQSHSELPVREILPPAPAEDESPSPKRSADNRIFSRRTPAELVDQIKGLTEVQAKHKNKLHIGQWMTIKANVADVSETTYANDIQVSIISESGPSLVLGFDANTWGMKVRSLDVGDQISAIGKIRDIRTMGQYGFIFLEECELINEQIPIYRI